MYDTATVIVPPDWQSALDVDRILHGQGINPAGGAPGLEPLRVAAASALAVGVRLIEPRVAAREVACTFEPGAVVFAGGSRGVSGALVEELAGAEAVLVAVCTVGDRIDRAAAASFDGDPVLSLALDGLACAAVDLLARAVCGQACLDAEARGWHVGNPLMPGMEGWALGEGQQLIFQLVDTAAIGVALRESGQMQPCKSLSFMAGLGPRVRRGSADACVRCGARRTCRWSGGCGGASGGL
ncbi:MAG TPA: hypothetical protein VGK32_11810 [Vicinamibacterales bacterium]